MLSALAGVAAMFVLNKLFDWGFLGRPVYLVDFFCFRPPERYALSAVMRRSNQTDVLPLTSHPAILAGL